MFYKKNQAPVLTDELFKNPTAEYRGTPFWAWNCDLEEKELLWQLEMLKKMGLSSCAARANASLHQGYQSTGLSLC